MLKHATSYRLQHKLIHKATVHHSNGKPLAVVNWHLKNGICLNLIGSIIFFNLYQTVCERNPKREDHISQESTIREGSAAGNEMCLCPTEITALAVFVTCNVLAVINTISQK